MKTIYEEYLSIKSKIDNIENKFKRDKFESLLFQCLNENKLFYNDFLKLNNLKNIDKKILFLENKLKNYKNNYYNKIVNNYLEKINNL